MVTVFLQPGHVHVATTPTNIITILASCVAVCLFDPIRGIGGMNHFLLPHPVGVDSGRGRFGPSAIAALIDGLIAAGSGVSDLRAKVFGGAAVVIGASGGRGSVGEQNLRCAFEQLGERRIPVVSSDVGGARGRKVMFTTGDGVALVKSL